MPVHMQHMQMGAMYPPPGYPMVFAYGYPQPMPPPMYHHLSQVPPQMQPMQPMYPVTASYGHPMPMAMPPRFPPGGMMPPRGFSPHFVPPPHQEFRAGDEPPPPDAGFATYHAARTAETGIQLAGDGAIGQGYTFVGNSRVCKACGKHFHVSDVASYNRHKCIAAGDRRQLPPSGLSLAAAAALAAPATPAAPAAPATPPSEPSEPAEPTAPAAPAEPAEPAAPAAPAAPSAAPAESATAVAFAAANAAVASPVAPVPAPATPPATPAVPAAASAAAAAATAAAAAKAKAKASSWAGRAAPAETRDASGPTAVPPPPNRKLASASASASASSASSAAAAAQKPRTYAQLLCDHEPLPSELVKLTLRREGGPEQMWGVRLAGDQR